MSTFDEVFPDSPDTVGGPGLEVIRMGESPTAIMLFTNASDKFDTHYCALPNLRGEFACNVAIEGQCLWCDLHEKPTERIALPVYDISLRDIKVLLMSTNRSPTALAPQIAYALRQGQSQDQILLIRRCSNRFTVQITPASKATDRGENVIRPFLGRLTAGDIRLKQCIAVCTNLDLWDIPELERKAVALGLTRSAYLSSATASTTSTAPHPAPTMVPPTMTRALAVPAAASSAPAGAPSAAPPTAE